MPTRRRPLAPGSIPHRIVEILGEVKGAIRFDVLVEACKAKACDVRPALQALIEDGRVRKLGGERGSLVRYEART